MTSSTNTVKTFKRYGIGPCHALYSNWKRNLWSAVAALATKLVFVNQTGHHLCKETLSWTTSNVCYRNVASRGPANIHCHQFYFKWWVVFIR